MRGAPFQGAPRRNLNRHSLFFGCKNPIVSPRCLGKTLSGEKWLEGSVHRNPVAVTPQFRAWGENLGALSTATHGYHAQRFGVLVRA